MGGQERQLKIDQSTRSGGFTNSIAFLRITAAQHANAYEFIVRFPDGIDHLLGDRGGCLSGGQRLRLAIARAWSNRLSMN